MGRKWEKEQESARMELTLFEAHSRYSFHLLHSGFSTTQWGDSQPRTASALQMLKSLRNLNTASLIIRSPSPPNYPQNARLFRPHLGRGKAPQFCINTFRHQYLIPLFDSVRISYRWPVSSSLMLDSAFDSLSYPARYFASNQTFITESSYWFVEDLTSKMVQQNTVIAIVIVSSLL